MGVKVKERPAGSGIYWIFIDHKGTRKAKKIGKDKRVAQEVAKKIEAKLTLGDTGLLEKKEPTVSSFGEYAKTWIEVTIPATCKPSTLMDYRSILDNHVLPAFAKTSVDQINRATIKQFLMEKINKGLAASTVGHMKSVLSGVLELAMDSDIIQSNPAQRLGKVFKVKNCCDEINPLTREELSIFLSVFNELFPRHYPLALTLARTGMRFGEALALQWGDIDFHGRFITIQRNFSRGKLGTPKNGKSRRVDMSMQLAEVLRALKHQRKVEVLKNGWGEMPKWVFITESGRPLDDHNWRKRVFPKVLDKAELRKIRIHDLRHTYASLLIQTGESLVYVRDQLGHHSIKITVDIYGHLAPGGNKAAVDRLDDASGMQLSATRTKKEPSPVS